MTSIRQCARRIREGHASCIEMVEQCLETIRRLDPALNAFITVTAAPAREQAREADRELAQGRDRGPLHGLPISLKDLIDVEHVPTTAASRARSADPATSDAPAVARLRAAGAVFIGKCNLHEFAFGTTGEDSAFGPTIHPTAPGYAAGGSSSGSAVSVAASMSVASIGTDTGGSIRIPAAACGVVGLKPSFGDVSCDGVVPLAPSLDHVGPLGSTVDDVAVTYRALVGLPTPLPARSSAGPARPPSRPLRLALLRPYFLDVLDDEVRGVFTATLERLREAGNDLAELDIPHAHIISSTYRTTQLYEAFRIHEAALARRGDEYSTDVRERLEMGREVSVDQYHEAQHQRTVLRDEVDTALGGADALLLPALPIPAPRLGAEQVILGGSAHSLRQVMLRLTQLANLTGHPALTIPCGTTRAGFPCGAQLIGGLGQTLPLLDVASACEATIRGEDPARVEGVNGKD